MVTIAKYVPRIRMISAPMSAAAMVPTAMPTTIARPVLGTRYLIVMAAP